ncbi:carotenoid oxygenase family protein [Pseudomonas sp. NGC7]|uniref:carotenoid oxygenase family protein n=1 Tax=Pseudomonas sp. NGC7 TaxID=3341775 RepID=UPI0037DA8207
MSNNKYPDHPFLKGNFRPITAECDAPALIVREGEIPEGLNGTLYRNGTSAMFPPLGDDHHWYLAEGMIHAIRIEKGQASYRNRWVKTEQYKAQREAGRRLISTSMNEPTPEENAVVAPHFAATHVLYHGEKLLALDEWCGPAALDGDTLETTHADWTFEGKHQGAFTAHPKVDPKSGEMLGYGYQATGFGSNDITFSVVDASGQLIRHDRFKAPFCPIMHDFGITHEHVIFPIFSADISVDRAAKGGPLCAYNPELGTHFGILARNASIDTMRWFKGDATYAYHTMNSFTEHVGGRTLVHLDMLKTQAVPLFPFLSGEIAPWLQGEKTNGLLVRWTFDLSDDKDSYSETVLTDMRGDFPVVDDRYVGHKYRHGFFLGQQGPLVEGAFFDTVCHLDLETGVRRDYYPGEGEYYLEPIFVPRSKSAPEGDGWLVTVAYNAKRNLSDFVVFDTVDITKGPIARVELPTRVPYGFHGSWRPL